ncbi:hypothetical protein RMCBS344292_13703 [Rhizopus microsporus]|nr:hypothetical protein RMCBS344292_13703 [Rhizopus microsporus]
MSSLASLINNIKANTAHNPLVQKNQKRKTTADSNAKQKKTKTMEEPKSNGPTVVVFDGSILERKPLFEDKSEKRRFMDSRVTLPDKPEQKQPAMTPQELEEEA